MIEKGKVAYLRTTQEPVFVLAIEDMVGGGGYFSVIVTVRRPVLSQGGMTHKIEGFYLEELATKEELLQGTRTVEGALEELFNEPSDPRAN